MFMFSSLSAQEVALPPAPIVEQMPNFPKKKLVNKTVSSSNKLSRNEVVQLWNNEYMNSEEVPINWTGERNNCSAGIVAGEFREATLRRINFYRTMAGLPGVTFSDDFNAKSQQAALMMIAKGWLSHQPGGDWPCYTPGGAEAAGKSNLALGACGPEAIDHYMEDHGDHNAAVGHRRWLLFPPQEVMGTGSTNASNNGFSGSDALWIIGGWGERPANTDFVAWPPRGFVPYQIVWGRWSFSYPDADFSQASVTMNIEGAGSPPIDLEPVKEKRGDNTIVWKPAYWLPSSETPQEDVDVQVHVENVLISGQPMSFEYTVTIIDPSRPGGGVEKRVVAEALLEPQPAGELDINSDGVIDAADLYLAQ